MHRRLKRNEIAMERNEIALRAGFALDRLVPAPNRDKTIARMFGVSVRMAVYLRAGQHWTMDHLARASATLGTAFDTLLWQPEADIEGARAEMTADEAWLVERVVERVREDARVQGALLAMGSAGQMGGPRETTGGVVSSDEAEADPVVSDARGRR